MWHDLEVPEFISSDCCMLLSLNKVTYFQNMILKSIVVVVVVVFNSCGLRIKTPRKTTHKGEDCLSELAPVPFLINHNDCQLV